jgi:DNA-binding LytR/AlgR family response regulator
MKLNCLIVDDEPLARKLLAEYIGDTDFLALKGMAENPVKANAFLNSNQVDLMFLDINMPKLNGIAFLRTASTLPATIITTAYAEYAIDGFELDVLDYLVKPISFERFLKAANKGRQYHLLKNPAIAAAGGNEDFLFVKCNSKIEKVFYGDLLYVEAMSNYVILHTKEKKLIVYLTLKGMMEQLPAPVFMKVHKSYIINLGNVKSIDGNEIDLGSAKVPVSQSLYEDVLKQIVKDKMLKR